MNLSGSYRRLLGRSKQAMISAIEIYNKPNFEFREETFLILACASWELFILAALSKNKVRIFKKKEPGQDYKTLEVEDATKAARRYIEPTVSYTALSENLKLLRRARNGAIHYLLEKQDYVAIYALSQASIVNYRDLMLDIFGIEFSDDINIALLPLSFNGAPDFVSFFRNVQVDKHTTFVKELISSMEILELENLDIATLVTTCSIKFEKTTDIRLADILAGRDAKDTDIIAVKAFQNPNDSHPFFQSVIIGNSKKARHKLLKRNLTSYQFQAILFEHDIKSAEEYCWMPRNGSSPQYSQKIFDLLNSLNESEIDAAITNYRRHLSAKK
jgi:hypothetical protein